MTTVRSKTCKSCGSLNHQHKRVDEEFKKRTSFCWLCDELINFTKGSFSD